MGYTEYSFPESSPSKKSDSNEGKVIKPTPDLIYSFIGNNQNASNPFIISYLMKIYGITKENAEDAIVRWAIGDKDWFNETFK